MNRVIIPIYYSCQVYDFYNHSFTYNKIEILIQNENNGDHNFIKYLPDNGYLTIDIHFIINFPYKNKKIKAIINAESNQDLEYKSEEIDIKKKQNLHIKLK